MERLGDFMDQPIKEIPIFEVKKTPVEGVWEVASLPEDTSTDQFIKCVDALDSLIKEYNCHSDSRYATVWSVNSKVTEDHKYYAEMWHVDNGTRFSIGNLPDIYSNRFILLGCIGENSTIFWEKWLGFEWASLPYRIYLIRGDVFHKAPSLLSEYSSRTLFRKVYSNEVYQLGINKILGMLESLSQD